MWPSPESTGQAIPFRTVKRQTIFSILVIGGHEAELLRRKPSSQLRGASPTTFKNNSPLCWLCADRRAAHLVERLLEAVLVKCPVRHRSAKLQRLVGFLALLGRILRFDPRREYSSIPTANSRSRRAQGLSRLAGLRAHGAAELLLI